MQRSRYPLHPFTAGQILFRFWFGHGFARFKTVLNPCLLNIAEILPRFARVSTMSYTTREFLNFSDNITFFVKTHYHCVAELHVVCDGL